MNHMENQTHTFDNAYWGTHTQPKQFRHEAALRLVKEANGPVMDIGCGDGLFLNLLKDQQIDAWGCDHSEAALTVCHQRGLDVEQCDFASGVLPARPAKTAALLDVLEHVYVPEQVLAALPPMIEHVIISVPNFVSLPARLQVLWGNVPENNRPSKDHVYWFTYDVLIRMLKKNGWTVDRLEYNTPWARVPLIGGGIYLLGKFFPRVIALSFVLRAKRI